jgi:hypothetical protein
MDLLHIDAVALPASVFYWTFLCLYRFLEPFLSSLIWRKRIASKCVRQSASQCTQLCSAGMQYRKKKKEWAGRGFDQHLVSGKKIF